MDPVWVSWWNQRKQMTADRAVVRPGTPLQVRSQHHLSAVAHYVVVERPDTLIRKLFRRHGVEVAILDAEPAVATGPSSQYRSRGAWAAAPPVYDGPGRTSFRAHAVDQTGLEHRRGGQVVCGNLRVVHHTEASSSGAVFAPSGTVAGLEIGMGDLSSSRGGTTTYVVDAAVDPAVEISIVSGNELAGLLRRTANDWGIDPDWGTVANHLVEAPHPAVTGHVVHAEVGPDQIARVILGLPPRDDLRSAYALRVRDRESDETVYSGVTFVTSIRGRLVTSEILPALLDVDARELLLQLDEERGDIAELARRLGTDPESVWARLVAVITELGVANVHDAAALAAATDPQPVFA